MASSAVVWLQQGIFVLSPVTGWLGVLPVYSPLVPEFPSFKLNVGRI
jgi:hypothetical protein